MHLWLGTAKPSTRHIYISTKLCLQIITPRRMKTGRLQHFPSLKYHMASVQLRKSYLERISNERLNGTVFCFYLENKTIYTQKWSLACISFAICRFGGVGYYRLYVRQNAY